MAQASDAPDAVRRGLTKVTDHAGWLPLGVAADPDVLELFAYLDRPDMVELVLSLQRGDADADQGGDRGDLPKLRVEG